MPYSTPTFSAEDDGLPAGEIAIVGYVVRDFLSTRSPHPDLEFDDLVQEALLHWWTQRPRYSSQRGASLATFLRRVVKAKLLDIERIIKAQKRGGGRRALSLDQSLDDEDLDADTLGEVLADSADTDGEATARIALDQALSHLSPRQRQLISGLEAGYSMSQLSRALRLPRTTLYDELNRIKQVFRDEGLAPHLNDPDT